MVLACLALFAALAMPFFRSLEVKSLRAEVRVMLSYMATLQQAYYTDTGRYAYFEEFYGGPLDGRENCLRPEGAEELGFKLKGCGRGPNNGGLRYAYQSLKHEASDLNTPSYLGRGTSSSDINGESYICLGSLFKDVWEVLPNAAVSHVTDCE